MRWRSGAVLLLLALWPRAGGAEEPAAPPATLRLAAAERTIEMVAAKSREHRARLAARVRAYSKLERAGFRRTWVEPSSRLGWLSRRAAMTRLLRRDLRELVILRAEGDAAVASRDRMRAELTAAAQPAPPARRSLVRPIRRARVRSGFGVQRHRASGADLSARGLELAARPGDPVAAVAAGRVLWTGPLAGGAQAVLVEHAGFVSVLVGFGALEVAPGQAVLAGQLLGTAAGEAIHLEIRLRTGVFGHPIDPAPLLAR